MPDPGDKGAAILDSVAYGLELLKKEPASNRRAILLISQEHDDGSKTTMKEIVRDLGETNTAMYSMTFSAEKTEAKQAFKDPHVNPPITTVPSDGSIKPDNDPARPFQGYFNLDAPLRLIFGAMQKNLAAEVANLSGGESNSFDNRNELDEALGRVNSHIRNSYILELLSDVDGAGTSYDQGFAGASSGDGGFGENELLGCGDKIMMAKGL